MPKSNKVDLIQQLFETVEVLGIDQTSEVLLKAKGERLTFNDEYVAFIINMVSSEFQIPIEEIIEADERNNKAFLALKFIGFYLYQSKKFTHESIGHLVKRHRSRICRYCDELSRDKQDPSHSRQTYFKKFDKKSTEFKPSNKK